MSTHIYLVLNQYGLTRSISYSLNRTKTSTQMTIALKRASKNRLCYSPFHNNESIKMNNVFRYTHAIEHISNTETQSLSEKKTNRFLNRINNGYLNVSIYKTEIIYA